MAEPLKTRRMRGFCTRCGLAMERTSRDYPPSPGMVYGRTSMRDNTRCSVTSSGWHHIDVTAVEHGAEDRGYARLPALLAMAAGFLVPCVLLARAWGAI